jgi:uracil-DNA glycosylase
MMPATSACAIGCRRKSRFFLRRIEGGIHSDGFCYPGAATNGGDNPPRPECAALWHDRLIKQLPNLELTLLVGRYAQRHYLGRTAKRSMTETVNAFAEYGPMYFSPPHPSWRTTIWIKKNRWFEDEVLPKLRKAVKRAIS